MSALVGTGSPEMVLSAGDAAELLGRGITAGQVKGKRVLVLTPDATRTCPLPMMIRALQRQVASQAAACDYMVALGSHRIMTEEEILKLFGISDRERADMFAGSRFLNHRWDKPESFVRLGRISEQEIEETTGGLFREAVDVDINRAALDYDLILILGPVFPHEVVGYSGGNKYLFPGISGGDFLHFFHWLGAVITCYHTIGHKHTPVRGMLDRAAAMLSTPRHCIAMVVAPGNRLAGLYVGSPEEAWSRAADLSARIHVRYTGKSYHTVLGRAPEMYDELWVAGKVMYKLEPVVADGGKLIIYAPHLTEISSTWGHYLERVGYHVRDYFLKRMERFTDIPRGVLAHSTHVRGLGTYEDGVEKPRIEVVLASAVPEAVCRKINLGYLDPRKIEVDDYRGRENEGVLFVDHAGEVLHRVKPEASQSH
jgi:nickel-dependent lactate racemase